MRNNHNFCCVFTLLFATSLCFAQPASNNSNAIYADGQFNLPSLGSGQNYILYFPGSKPITWPLPEGTTILRAPMPKGVIEWQAFASPGKVVQLALSDPATRVLESWNLIDGKLGVGWLPPAESDFVTKYKISGKEITINQVDVPEKDWGALGPIICDAQLCPKGITIPLKAGYIARYKIEALDSHDIVIAESVPQTVTINSEFSEQVKSFGFKLSRSDSLNKSVSNEPALLNWGATKREGEVREASFHTEFALIWEDPNTWKSIDWYRRASLEASLTSDGKQKASDALRLRYGMYKIWQPSPGIGAEFVGNLKYETEYKGGTKKGLVELAATPRVGILARSLQFPSDIARDGSGNAIEPPWLTLKPLVILGAEFGKTFDTGSSVETNNTLLRWKTIFRLETTFPKLAATLNIPSISSSLQATYWRLPREIKKEYAIGRASLSFGLRNGVSFELSHSVGRDSPNFKFVRNTVAGIGLQF